MDLHASGSSMDWETSESTFNSQSSPEKGTPKKRGGRKKKRVGRKRATSPVPPLQNPQVGDIVWGKVRNSRWWPGILVDEEDCGELAKWGGRKTNQYIYWYGDRRISPVASLNLVDFRKGYKKFIHPEGRIIFKSAVFMAIEDVRTFLSLSNEGWDIMKALAWADDGFPLPEGGESSERPVSKEIILQNVRKKLQQLRLKYEGNNEDDKGNQQKIEDDTLYLEYTPEALNLLSSVRDETLALDKICLACVRQDDELQDHPLFEGGLCRACWNNFLERYFAIGSDYVSYHCAVCLNVGDMMVCSRPQCFRAYCNKCIAKKATLGVLDIIRNTDPWLCFFCEPYSPSMHGLIKPRTSQWKQKLQQIFHPNVPSVIQLKENPVRILCLDGSCKVAVNILSAVNLANIMVEALYICNFNEDELAEVKKLVSNPENVHLVKSMIHYEDYKLLATDTPGPIQIVIGSSSGTTKESLGRYFFSFHNILSMVNVLNNFFTKSFDIMWMFEALPPIWDDYSVLITRFLQAEPTEFSNSLIWTNILKLGLNFDESQSKCLDENGEKKKQVNPPVNQDDTSSEEEASKIITRSSRKRLKL